jgi:hypothetical protein
LIWLYLNFTPISLSDNNIRDDTEQRIENALEINRNLFKIWTQRKHFLIFISQLSLPLSSDNVNVNFVGLNVRKVLELEEMKREMTNFL